MTKIDWKTKSMYSFSEAAILAGVSATAVRSWLLGYGDRTPLFPHESSEPQGMVSFLQMIEVMVAGRLRKSKLGTGRGVSFKKLRDAYLSSKKELSLDYPFAHLELDAVGGHVVRFLQQGDSHDSHQAMAIPAQWTMPETVRAEIEKTVGEIDYDRERGLADRWYPEGRAVPIVVDPRISAGMPVVEGRGVTVRAVGQRFKSGMDIEFIAKDFEISNSTVQEIIRYGVKIAA